MRSTLIRLIALLAVAAVAGMGYYLVKRLPEKKQEVPLFQVKRGDLTVKSYVRGELRAIRSSVLTTPNLGAAAQITRLAPAGALAQTRDLIVEFDDSELLATVEDTELEVTQVGENLRKAEADQSIRRNQEQVDLLRARYAVRRAELEVKRNELISKIDARKNELTLKEAKQSLAKLEEDVKSRLQQGEAELAVLREQRRKALLEVDRVKKRLEQTRLLSPMTGLVAIMQNRAGERSFGQQSPDIREGDQVSPGMALAEILDLSELEVAARVNELERASLREGQDVIVRLDALPGKIVHGKIKSLSGTASSSFFSNDPTKKFDCVFSIDMREMMTHVGATPQQIDRITATAVENAKRFQPSAAPRPMLAAGGLPGMAMGGPGEGPPMAREGGGEGGRRRGSGGGEGRPEGERRRGGGAGFGGRGGGGEAGGPRGAVPDEDRQKMRQAFEQALGGRNMQAMSQEERQKFIEEMRQKMPAGATLGGGRGGPGGMRGGREGAAEASGPGGPQAPMVVQFGRGGSRGGGDNDVPSLSLSQGAGQQFNAEERAKAQLPAAPEENSVMDVLLRPGLLVEAEIIVESIPNAIYVPQQGVFERGDRPVVYVRNGARHEPRVVRLGKRTESQVAVVEGLKEGEWILMADPENKPSPKKSKEAPRSQPALPTSGAGPGGGGGGRGGPG